VRPQRLFLDTNVFIIGSVMPDSPEASILEWLGFFNRRKSSPVVIVSDVLIEQILRVGRRVGGKDYSGELIVRLWQNLSVDHVTLKDEALHRLNQTGAIPREDVAIFLTAVVGRAECFVSANYKLIKALAAIERVFECLTPTEFVTQYIAGSTAFD